MSPSESLTVNFTYFVSAYLKVLTNLHPVSVSQTIDPLLFSKLQVQVSGPLPVDRVPSSVTGVLVVTTPVGAVQTAAAGTSVLPVGLVGLVLVGLVLVGRVVVAGAGA